MMRGRKTWPLERVNDSLRRFYSAYQVTPTNSEVYDAKLRAESMNQGHSNFPVAATIFRYYSKMRDAWAGAGVEIQSKPRCPDCRVEVESYTVRSCKLCARKRMSRSIRAQKQHKYSFTPPMDARIEEVYRTVKRSAKEKRVIKLAEEFGFPRWRVCKRAAELGLTQGKEPPWTAAELAIVEEFSWMSSPYIRRKLIEKGFKRTEAAIHIILVRRNIRAANTPYYTGTQIAKLLGEDGHAIMRWAEAGLIPFQMKGSKRQGPQHGDIRMFHEVDVYLFLINHRTHYDLRKVNQSWLLEMLIDFPAANHEAIAKRRQELGLTEEPAWSISKWKVRKPNKSKKVSNYGTATTGNTRQPATR